MCVERAERREEIDVLLTRAGSEAWNAIPQGLDILEIPIGQEIDIRDFDRGQLQLRRRHSALFFGCVFITDSQRITDFQHSIIQINLIHNQGRQVEKECREGFNNNYM